MKDAAEPSRLELKGVIRDRITPDHGHRFELWFEVSYDRALHHDSMCAQIELSDDNLTQIELFKQRPSV